MSVEKDEIILCQPDDKKSCGVCCGIFNFKDISQSSIERYLYGGAERSPVTGTKQIDSSACGKDTIRDNTTYICPHVGFIARGKPGCLIHPLLHGGRESASSRRKQSFYGDEICEAYLCPAHSILNSEEKILLINNVSNWYHYSIAIIDPESFLWILKVIQQEIPLGLIEKSLLEIALTESLGVHADYLDSRDGNIFYYSIPEYAMEKKNFSLLSGEKNVADERTEIIRIIKKVLSTGNGH